MDTAGYSLALSANGTVVAVGSPGNDENGRNAGHVRVFHLSMGLWYQLGQNIQGEDIGDRSGVSLAMTNVGMRIAVGATGNSGNRTLECGHVRVYDFVDDTGWVQVGQDIDGESWGDQSGFSIAISSDGSRLAVGAPFHSNGTNHESGYVRTFDWKDGNWTQVGQSIYGTSSLGRTGFSVGLSSDGSVLAIGSPRGSGRVRKAGYVAVYSFEAKKWVQIGKNIEGKSTENRFGWSIAMNSNGSRVVVGAPFNKDVGFRSGQVQVYERVADHWKQFGQDIIGEANGDLFGRSVAMNSNGTRIAIGATGNGQGAGHVRVYNLVQNAWKQAGADIEGETPGDQSGFSVDMSSDGSTIAIGATVNDGQFLNSVSGHVRIYEELCLDNSFTCGYEESNQRKVAICVNKVSEGQLLQVSKCIRQTEATEIRSGEEFVRCGCCETGDGEPSFCKDKAQRTKETKASKGIKRAKKPVNV